MKILFFICYFILSTKIYAQTVLVPHSSVNLQNYLVKCRVDGYQCTQDYFKNSIVNSKSEAFAILIETIDLYNEDYRKNLFYKIKNLVSNEQISLDEIDLLVKIISRFESIDKNSQLTLIKSELLELAFDLKNMSDERSDDESFMVFKKVLSKRQFKIIKYKIRFSLVTRITPYTAPHRILDASVPLIAGDCENPEYAPLLSRTLNLKYTALYNFECASTVALSSTIEPQFNFQKYKMPLIYSVAGIALLSFFSHYKVEVNF